MRPRFVNSLRDVAVLTDIFPSPIYGYYDPSYAYKAKRYRVQFRKFALVVAGECSGVHGGSVFGPSDSMLVSRVARVSQKIHTLQEGDTVVFVCMIKNTATKYSKKSTWPTVMDHFIYKFKMTPKVVIINKASTSTGIVKGQRHFSKRFTIETSPLGWFQQNLRVDPEIQVGAAEFRDGATVEDDYDATQSDTIKEEECGYSCAGKLHLDVNHIFLSDLCKGSDTDSRDMFHLLGGDTDSRDMFDLL
jgi:hypothetical protein